VLPLLWDETAAVARKRLRQCHDQSEMTVTENEGGNSYDAICENETTDGQATSVLGSGESESPGQEPVILSIGGRPGEIDGHRMAVSRDVLYHFVQQQQQVGDLSGSRWPQPLPRPDCSKDDTF
jgi:hypothetical protein